MCGIAGFWQASGAPAPGVAEAMAAGLKHRGPDDSDVFVDPDAGLAMSHTRLAVIDLSAAGHQPMTTACGRFTLIYNGEIYNHAEIRAELLQSGEPINWAGHSDTETLLYGLRRWGVEKTLGRLNGMFAFALWDSAERTLCLARDRMGEKPIYYGRVGGTFLFGSELSPLRLHPDWAGETDRDSLALFLNYSYVPTPRSIYRGISKLAPGHFVVVRDRGTNLSKPVCYWNLRDVALRGIESIVTADAAEAADGLNELLLDAVRLRMLADVPVGAFLSGGIDSSSVVALMQAVSARPVRTFTIGFNEPRFNEAKFASAVARHLGTDHTELYVSEEDARSVIPELPRVYDEPFADSSQIPTYLISRLARQHVTVALSGDGGDELFCGYNRYAVGYQVWNKLRRLPPPMRSGASRILRALPGRYIDRLAGQLPTRFRPPHFADGIAKLAAVAAESSPSGYYRRLVSQLESSGEVVIGAGEASLVNSIHGGGTTEFEDVRNYMMYMDSATYLPDDILTKVDRASMAVSLEARVPLLDHRVVEFAWRLPIQLKYRANQGKWVLRKVLHRYVPEELVSRPKSGFAAPIDTWLRGPLKQWSEDLLDERRLRREGYFDVPAIRQMWLEFAAGRQQSRHALWNVLMFESWLAHHEKPVGRRSITTAS